MSIMLKNQINIISLFLLMLFIIPSVNRIFHHHKLFVCLEKNVKHFHKNHRECKVCKFEFSFYTLTAVKKSASKITFSHFLNNYTSAVFIERDIYSFSLRAPPVV